MKKDNAFILKTGFSMTLMVAATLWLWLGAPEYLLYQEQYQLFLFSPDYLADRLSLPGGFADWLGEFVVQFYYVPLYGALLSGFVLTLTQIFLGLAFRRAGNSGAAYAFASLPSILYLGAAGDENTLFSFAAAMMLTAVFIAADSCRKRSTSAGDAICLTAGFLALYWLAGPIAFAYVLCCGILRKTPVATAIAVAAGTGGVWIMHSALLEQYPYVRLLQGLNYYRIPEVTPAFIYAAAASFLLPAVAALVKVRRAAVWSLAASVAVAVFAAAWIPAMYDSDKSRVIQYDALVRQGRWSDIIERSRKEPPSDIFCIQALNLALGMTGQLADVMFEFRQEGVQGLVGEGRLDNTTPLVTAEALYRLGLTNIAFSTVFDMQESIMNDRKSGRFMKRLAECAIINGNYKVAEKYIRLLKQSLYYADWADEAETLLYNDTAVGSHPVYGPLRKLSFRRVAFYDRHQIEKILAMSAADSDGHNRLAWQYFCAAAMLKGDLRMLTGVYASSGERFDKARIPRHVQEAIAMYWTSGHPTFEGLPLPIDGKIKKQTMELANTVASKPNSPEAWERVAPGSFSLYFLRQMTQKPAQQQPTQLATNE